MKRLVAVLLLLSLLGLAACALDPLPTRVQESLVRPLLTEPVSEGERQIETILQLVQNEQFQVLHSWLTAESQSRITVEMIEERRGRVYESLGVRSVDLEEIQKMERASDDKVWVYEMNMVLETRYGIMQRPLTLTFLHNAATDRFELDWTPSLLFPGLTEGNDIVVEVSRGQRGGIYDRNGLPLAVEGESMTVGAVAGSYNEESNAQVAELLGLAEEYLEKTMAQDWIDDGMFVPLTTEIAFSPVQIEKFPQYGLTVRKSKTRIYPQDEALAHLIGYVGEVTEDELLRPENADLQIGDLVGKRGLEAHYDEELRPTGGVTVYLSGTNRQVLYESKPQDGSDFYLTIDASLQNSLYEFYRKEEAQVVVLQPETGEVLALLSTPSFSPNAFVQGMTNEAYNALLEDPQLPMLTRFQLRYAPGSTAKPLTWMAGFNLGIVDAASEKTIYGLEWQPGPHWGNHHVVRVAEYNEAQDIRTALVRSDNIFFAQIAVEAGAERFVEAWQALGIGEEVPCEYPFYSAQFSNDGTLDNEVLLADAAYGQGQFQITAIQLAAIYSAVVSEGTIMQPYLLLERAPEAWKSAVAAPATLSLLAQAMRESVEFTHVNTVEREYARLAGKSGTVETAWDDELDTQGIDSWFIGYDMDNPQFMLAVQLQNIHRREDEMTGPIRFGQTIDLLYDFGRRPYEVAP